MKKHEKRLSAPKAMPIKRKAYKFVAKVRPGPHPRDLSVPLVVLLRDMLNVVKTRYEAKRILSDGLVYVDGRRVKDLKFPVGFMDVISFKDIDDVYRVLVDRKGRITSFKTDKKERNIKLVRINNKTTVKNGRIQLNMHDGRNILADDTIKSLKVGDVLKIEVPSQKILEKAEMKPGSTVYIFRGKHSGLKARIKEIRVFDSPEDNVAVFEADGDVYETKVDYLFVIGEKEDMIHIG